jgi:hypothetical protein
MFYFCLSGILLDEDWYNKKFGSETGIKSLGYDTYGCILLFLLELHDFIASDDFDFVEAF